MKKDTGNSMDRLMESGARRDQDTLPARPEMVARGRALLADASYPGIDTARVIARELFAFL